jgi:uncharacterized protein involved in exopolysaccharide biosynthesis
MQDLMNSKSNNEVDLRDIFITLWAYKLFIASTCALGIILSGYYTQNAKKEFTSEASFRITKEGGQGLNIGADLGALASLAGYNIPETNVLHVDQVMGRVFVEKLDESLNFRSDPYFNTYRPNSVDPIWKSLLKRILGWQKFTVNAQEAIWQNIVTNYSENVEIDETPEGTVKVAVTHLIPQRAAEIANGIMEEIISSTKYKMEKEQDQILSYLSNTLAKALNDLEVAQSNLKEFTLENSAMPLKSFVTGSLELDVLREKLTRTSELQEAMAALMLMLQNNTTSQDNYQALRQKFPIVDQVEFRRVLGQTEIISSWSWPEASTVGAIYDTLTERKSRLQSNINASQIDAERSSLSLETYGKLEREAKVAEATYTVLIEQVKAQSMAAGFRPDKTEVYEYASVSIKPSAPNRSQILALGAVLSLFIGIALSLLFAFLRGVYYSKEALKNEVQARLTASARDLLPLRKKSFKDLNTMLLKKPRTALRDLAVEIHNSNTTQVVVTSSRAKLTANDMARALASYMQSDSMRIMVIDFSSKTKRQDNDPERLSIGSFVVAESDGNVSALKPADDFSAMELLSQKDFIKNLQSLSSTVNLLFLCADNDDAISLLRALQGRKTFHVTLARIKHTKYASLAYMRSFLPIQGLIHD